MRHTRFNVPGVVILIVVEVISFVTKICPGFIDVELYCYNTVAA